MLGTFKVNIPDDKDILPWGKELIYRNGVQAGYVTSAGYGYSIGAPICMGYVHSSDDKTINTGYLRKGEYEIEIEGRKWPAEISTGSFYDPNSINMKC